MHFICSVFFTFTLLKAGQTVAYTVPSTVSSTVQSAATASHLPGSCSFVSNDTCGYELHSLWSVHKGEFIFHRPIILNGADDAFFALTDPFYGADIRMVSPEIPPGDYDLSFYFIIPARAGFIQINISTEQSSYAVYEINGRFLQWQRQNISIKEEKSFRIVFLGEDVSNVVIGIDFIQITRAATEQHYVETTTKFLRLEDAVTRSCSSSGWNFTVDTDLLQELYPGINTSDIYWGTSNCTGVAEGNLLVFQYGLLDCKTSEEISDGVLKYSNTLYHTITDPYNPFLVRDHKWTYKMECDVIQNEIASSHVHHEVESHSSIVISHYDVSIAFYKDASFSEKVSGNPLVVNVGDTIFVKVFTTDPDWTVKIKLHTCFTRPSSDSSDSMKYYLIKDGCEVDSTTHIMSQSTHESTFMFQDFEYSTYHEGLDITCNATFCNTSDFSPHCSQGCSVDPQLIG